MKTQWKPTMGRIGRMILFRECLLHRIIPVIIEDSNRNEYLEALKEYRENHVVGKLTELFEKEQIFYLEKCEYFLA